MNPNKLSKESIRTAIVSLAFCLILIFMFIPAIPSEIVRLLVSDTLEHGNVSVPIETNNIKYAIDKMSEHAVQYMRLLEISGWTFIDGEASKMNMIFLVLASHKNVYTFRTCIDRRRTDIPKNSAFNSIIPWNMLHDGIYRLGILIEGKDEEAFQYTARVITVEKNNFFPFRISFLQNLSLPKVSDNIMYHIDTIDAFKYNDQKFFKLTGWAYINGKDSVGSVIYIVLLSDGETYVFDTTVYKRPDVTAHFKALNYDDSGFNFMIPENFIDKGIYKIGIYIKKGKLAAFQYTDKIIARK